MSVLVLTQIDPSVLPLQDGAAAVDIPVLSPDDPNSEAWQEFSSDARGQHFLAFVASYSDFLRNLMRRDTAKLAEIIAQGPDAALATSMADILALDDEAPADATIMRRLRQAKRHVALTVAVADLLGLWSLDQIVAALSDFAESALERSVRHAMRVWRGRPGTEGLVVLGMGKFGSRELNYSSDIDLIVLYDADRLNLDAPDRLHQDIIRVTRNILRLMDERTGDGYVFRTDLRLRPDPSATPLALSVLAAESYYESVGQNWERAAMIKARPVAGDLALGEEFLTHIRPFIWRKYLDFAAIQDIHSIKRQINAYRGGGEIAVDGHNIKIGRGGIREIEFFAQTQQLIWGGRTPELRVRATCSALEQLHQQGHVSAAVVAEMRDAYGFLRRLEHRLQMVADQQTQALPATPDGMAAIAGFMGYGDVDAFRAAVRSQLEIVAGHYARLFEESPDLGGGGSLVFTGTEDDPDTLQTLTEMGFANASHIAGRIRVWHHGRYRATRSERTRQILTELMPRLLQAFADTANPDDAFMRFDNFLSGLPSGVQLFSLFQAHPALLDLLSEILGSAPRLAEWLFRKPILLDSVLSGDFFEPIDDADAALHQRELETALAMAPDYQDVLDAVRRWTNDRKFRIGVHLMQGLTDGPAAGPALSTVAEASLAAVLPASHQDFAEQHGYFPGPGMAVLAFGKLGGGELMPMSDLDLVFVYDTDPSADVSDGAKPIGPQVYYQRLCQRLVTAITTETGEGRLYEVDIRLRPSGKAGPLATQRSGFEAYYRLPDGEAWTWEHMALTRARAVYGDAVLRAELTQTIRDALCQRRDLEKLYGDVRVMRQRVEKEFPAKSVWDIKYRRGGLVDVEFITQTLQLAHAADEPSVLSQNTDTALQNLLTAGIVSPEAARDLRAGLALWRRLQSVIRLTATGGGFDAGDAPEGQKRAIARAAGLERFEALEPLMQDAADKVMAQYQRLIMP